MTTENLIQLGTLIITSLGIISSGAYFLYKWYISKALNPKIEIILLKENRYPIRYFSMNIMAENPKAVVEYICAWFKITLTNHSDKPIILEKVLAYEEGLNEKPFFNTAVKKLYIDRDRVIVEGPIEFPLSINSNRPYSFYFMGEISIPNNLGVKFAEIYGKETDLSPEKLRKISNELQEKIIANNKKMEKILGIGVVSSKLQVLGVHLPTKNPNGEKTFYNNRFGELPNSFLSNEIMNFSDNTEEYVSYLKSSYQNYIVKLIFSDNTIREKSFPINNSSVWFNKEIYGI